MYSICVSIIKICTVAVLIVHIDQVWRGSKVFLSTTIALCIFHDVSREGVKDLRLLTEHKMAISM